MDFFTHLMFGFLVSSWASGNFYNPYVILGSLLAVLPDFDIFLFPLWKRFPFASHHGITHTAIFVVVVSPLIALFSKVWIWNDLHLLSATGVMVVTGFMHLGCDALTNWGTPILYPLSKKYYNLGVDVAVNVYLMLWFFVGVLFLALVRFSYIPALNMEMASGFLGFVYLSYFALRGTSKLYCKKKYGKEFALLPTEKPWHWKMAKRWENEREIVVAIRNANGLNYYRIPKQREKMEIKSCEDMVYTYYMPEVKSHLSVFRYPYYKLNCNNGIWEIVWYVAEMHPRMNLRVEYRDGKFTVRSWW